MKIVVFDSDYTYNRAGEPVIRIYGRKVNGDGVIVHVKSFEPYFYCEEISEEQVMEVAGEYIKRIDKVMRYKPIGYQKEKTDMLKVILHNPRVTPEVRGLLEKAGGLLYEADILFRNRFLIDTGINGMSVIEFNEIGKELADYGLNCKQLYIIGTEDIRITDEIVKIEY